MTNIEKEATKLAISVLDAEYQRLSDYIDTLSSVEQYSCWESIAIQSIGSASGHLSIKLERAEVDNV